jgi:hypothetical protein
VSLTLNKKNGNLEARTLTADAIPSLPPENVNLLLRE